jgi:spore coat protein U-like protein
MEDYLVHHARTHVWCTPDQDNQVIIKPARITPVNGVWGQLTVLWTTVPLPEPLTRFHVFQVGQLNPVLLNLFDQEGQWVTFADAMVRGKNICDIYTTLGVQIPRTQTWYMLTAGMNVLIAVKKNTRLPYDFNDLDLYLRTYSNEYFASERAQLLTDYVDVQGGLMRSALDISTLQNKYTQATRLPGGVYAFVNGYKVPAISIITVKVGDVAEYVYDSAIDKVVDFKLDQLDTFDSSLDAKGKYLLHYAGSQDTGIDFMDDIDLFLVNALSGRGVYVHKNAADALRMLSHRDYSVPVAYLAAYLVHFKNKAGAVDFSNLYLRLHVRKSGYRRLLVPEANRINELYKLSDVALTQAMLGIESNVPVWRANALESSGYAQLMNSAFLQVTPALVKRTYGYSAVAKLVADTPSSGQVLGGKRVVSVPYLLSSNATAFEYDAQGVLLQWHRHTSGLTYVCKNTLTACVEMIAGEGTRAPDAQRTQVVTLDSQADYRFYSANIRSGLDAPVWQDVTGSGAYTTTPTGARWLLADDAEHHLVLSDKRFLLYEESVPTTDGLMVISLTALRSVNGAGVLRALDVPLGELDVFLNGRSLIEGLDYTVKFPHLSIVNKKYLLEPQSTPQTVVIRFTGFCNAQLMSTQANEFGFIQNGKASVNQRFDVRDAKVLRIVCGGRLKLREQMVFSEDTQAYDFLDAKNGQPYLVRDIVVPMWGLADTDTYAYRAQSLLVDQSISDYMSLKVPEPAVATVNPALERHTLYSPFVCKILHDLVSGALSTALVQDHYNDDLVRALCAPYLYLLDYDPIHAERVHDADHVEIHPHQRPAVMTLTLPGYRFLGKVVRLYANGRLALSPFVKLV